MGTFFKITGIILLVLIVAAAGFIAYVYFKIKNIKDTHDLQLQIDGRCNRYMKKEKAAGLFVGIIQGDKVYTAGYGLTDKENGTKPDSNTIFEIGSISKVFTAEIAQLLTDQSQLNWNDNIIKFLPQQIKLPRDDSTTLLHLASHTSGFPRLPEMWYPAIEKNECDPYSSLTMNDLYAYLNNSKDKKKPSPENYDYSNLGAGLLGHILEWETGKSYEALLQEYICNPLNMHHTSLTVADSSQFATAYDEAGKKTCHWNFPIIYGAGAIRSTGADMLRFLKANMGDHSVLSASFKKTQEEVTAIPMGAVGKGWHIDKANGALWGVFEIVWHNGGTGGFRSYIGVVPGKDRGVVVWTNQSNENFDQLAIDIMIKTARVSLK